MAIGTIYIVDLNDGPAAGAGVALMRALRKGDVPFKSYALSPMDSGWRSDCESVLASESDLLELLRGRDADDWLVPASRDALDLLESLAAHAELELPEECQSPLWPQLAEAAEEEKLALAYRELITAIPDREVLKSRFESGFVLNERRCLHVASDGEAAWYRFKKNQRAGSRYSVLIPSLGKELFMACHVFDQGEARFQVFMRCDSLRPSWRLALGRSVAGPVWKNATKQLEELDLGRGFLSSLWLHAPGEEEAQLVSTLPLPAAFIAVAEQQLCSAILGENEEVPADLYYADAPVDLVVRESTLLERLNHA